MPPLLETPPDSVRETLRTVTPRVAPTTNGDGPEHHHNGHENGHAHVPEPRLSLKADITQEGKYGERWFVVDHSHVRVLSPASDGGSARVDLDLALSDIREAKTESLVGASRLLLITKDGRTIEAVRTTLAHGPAFGAAARAIESYLKDEEPPASLGEDLKKQRCPKCADPLPDDTNVCPKCVDRRAVLMRLLGYALPYRSRAIVFTILALAATGVGLAPPLFQRYLVDDVLVPHHHAAWIAWLVAGLVVTSAANIGLTIWRGRLAAWMSNHMVYTIRTQVYDRLQELSLGYYDKRQTGSLLARVVQDVTELQNFLVDGIQFFLVNTLTILGILAILLWNNWLLTLLVLIPVPVTVILTKRIWRFLWGRMHRMWHLRSNLTSRVSAALSGVRVVKAFAQEAREAQRFRTKSFDLFGAGILVEQSLATYMPILGFITTLGIYIVWFVGGFEVFHNRSSHHGMTLGVLTMFLSYIGMLMAPLQGMTRIADWMSRATAAAERVFEVIDAEPDVADSGEAVSMPRIEGHVELRHVRFSYDKNSNVLDDVSIDVKAGEMIGLVGHSGAGKSTIINLLSRFYDVKDGEILIDGVDIRNIKQNDLRRQVGVVLQEPFLFPGTIAENIAYAKPDATPAEIMRAAKAANAHDFVMRFADGYDTYVGERGARLSGGERQRLSIARAILHDPRILILDEATASVDTETEKQIQEAIGRLIEGRTTFAIAHRLSTLRNASRLMVMERGKMVELGTHDELLAMPEGVFKKLVDMQQEVNKLKETV
jgi:ATP-binding cassette subfamily B protein